MGDQTISVVLASPAKINGKREPAGKTVTVSLDMALELELMAAIDPGTTPITHEGAALEILDGIPLGSDFDQAVEEALAAREIELAAVAAEELAKVKEEHATELAAVLDRATVAETKVGELDGLLKAATERADTAEAKVTAFEAAAKPDTPPADPKPAGKKA